MRRHFALTLLRVLLAAAIVAVLPYSHLRWGPDYPGDGQDAVGFIVIFLTIGLVVGAFFLVLGSLAQFWLRRRPPRWTLLVDLALFLVLSGVLAYGGSSARYEDPQPQGAAVGTG